MSTHKANTVVPRLTISECSKLGGVSENTIRRRIADGTLPAYKLGRSIRIQEADFAALFTRIPTYRGEL